MSSSSSGLSGGVGTAMDLSIVHPLVLAAFYYYAVRSAWLKQSEHDRIVGLFTGVMGAAVYATTVAFLENVDTPELTRGIKTDIIKPVMRSLLTLGGCVILPFFQSFPARVAAILTNTLMGHVITLAQQLGWKLRFQPGSSVLVIAKLVLLLLGLLGVRGLFRLQREVLRRPADAADDAAVITGSGGVRERPFREYLAYVGVVVVPGCLEMALSPTGQTAFYMWAMVAVLVSGCLSSWFLNKEELLVLMVSNVLGIGCVYTASRVFIVYTAVLGLCILSYRQQEEFRRFQYLSLAALSLGLLGVSIVSTQSVGEDKKWQPYTVVGFFMLSATMIVRLVAKRKFQAMLSGFIYFPVLYSIASFLDQKQLKLTQPGETSGAASGNAAGSQEEEATMFAVTSMSHLLALLPNIVSPYVGRLRGETGWKLSYILLFHTMLFQLGLETGHVWFQEKTMKLSSAFRLTALLTSFAGFFRATWEARFYSLLVSITLGEVFLFPISATVLCLVFWGARAGPPFLRTCVLYLRRFLIRFHVEERLRRVFRVLGKAASRLPPWLFPWRRRHASSTAAFDRAPVVATTRIAESEKVEKKRGHSSTESNASSSNAATSLGPNTIN